MVQQTNEKGMPTVITAAELLAHWQGHRRLTRRLIEAFPESELFTYSIGGMRPFAAMVQELLAIAAPGLRQIAEGTMEDLHEHFENPDKDKLLAMWDKAQRRSTVIGN